MNRAPLIAVVLTLVVIAPAVAFAPTPTPVPVATPIRPGDHRSTATSAPFPSATPGLTNDQTQQIDKIALRAISDQALAGLSLAVVRDNRVVYSRGYGYSSIELQQPARDASLYEIGSISKQFTSAGILLLAEDGKLTVDDPLSRFLPDFPRAKEITLRHLLTMTSGIPDYTDLPGFDALAKQPTAVAGIVAKVKGQPLDFDPGTQWEYSNTNYVLLGMVIEKVSGQDYGSFLFQRIFRPVSLGSTRYGNVGASSPDLATGYVFDGQRMKPDSPWNLDWAYSAGGIVSNALDLAVWDASLVQGNALTLSSVRAMWTQASLKDTTKVPYGFGWSIESMYGHRELDDNGGLPGYNGRNAAFPNDRFDIVVLANSKSFDAGPAVRQIFALFFPPTKVQIAADAQGDGAAAARARDVFRRLQAGNLGASQLTPAATKRLTSKLMAQAKASLGRLGAPVKFEQTDKYVLGTQTVYAYRLTFKQAVLGFSVSLDSGGKVGELSVQPL